MYYDIYIEYYVYIFEFDPYMHACIYILIILIKDRGYW